MGNRFFLIKKSLGIPNKNIYKIKKWVYPLGIRGVRNGEKFRRN